MDKDKKDIILPDPDFVDAPIDIPVVMSEEDANIINPK